MPVDDTLALCPGRTAFKEVHALKLHCGALSLKYHENYLNLIPSVFSPHDDGARSINKRG